MISISETGLVIHDLIGGNVDRLDAMLALFVEMFPQYTHYADRIRHTAERPNGFDPGVIHHQWLADVEGQAAGMVVFKYLPERRCGLGIDLAVRPAFRKRKFSRYDRLSELLNKCSLDQLEADALAAGDPTPFGKVVEVETPESTDDEQLKQRRAHLIERYRSFGMIQLPMKYCEPPYILGLGAKEIPAKETFHPMQLGVFPIDGGGFDPHDPTVLADCVLAFLVDHYRLPADHWAVQRALDSIH